MALVVTVDCGSVDTEVRREGRHTLGDYAQGFSGQYADNTRHEGIETSAVDMHA